MSQILDEKIRDLILAVCEIEVGAEDDDNADLRRAYELACAPETPQSPASTRALAKALIDGLNALYAPDIYAEDADGRQWGCPLRWCYFAACELLRLLDESQGVAWWQVAAREAAQARALRDATTIRALDLAA